MKRTVAVLMSILLCMTLFGCGSKSSPAVDSNTSTGQNADAAANQSSGEENKNYKIVIMTNTVTQGEEAYRAAAALVEKYGSDRIIHDTYPDKASSEQETTVSTIMQYASDPDVKCIIGCPAMEGSAAGWEKVREARPDILLLAGTPTEDPTILGDVCDLMYGLDMLAMGTEVADTAKKMGAKTLVHYSFPRHMANVVYQQRHDNMKARCEELGIEFVDGTTPDPMAEAGVSATQQYILEDVPRKVEQYGKDIAFFSTNVGMHEALIKSIYDCGAMLPHPDAPSPFYCFPGALGIEVPEDKAGDYEWMAEQISAKLADKGMTGRMGIWMPPSNPHAVQTLVEYATRIIESGCGPEEYHQPDLLMDVVKEVGEGRYSATLQEDAGCENYYGFISETVLL